MVKAAAAMMNVNPESLQASTSRVPILAGGDGGVADVAGVPLVGHGCEEVNPVAPRRMWK